MSSWCEEDDDDDDKDPYPHMTITFMTYNTKHLRPARERK